MNPEKIKKDARRKKAVYGWTSVILTVVIVALVILGNAVLYKINWRIDLTTEKIYTVSDEADKIFSALGNRDIEIIFFTPFDELGNNMSQNMLYQYCLSLEQRYDYISLRYIDLLNHPEAAKPYQSTNVPDIDLDDVIISNGEGGFKKCKIEWFFNFDRDSNSLVGFYAEYRIASTIMQLSYDERLALFTTGHGEEIEGTMVCTLLQDAGFTVRSIDLSKEDIPDGTRLLIINDPMYDFKGVENTVNELSKVDRYLDGYGNLIVFESPEKSNGLRNLSELLSEWGIEFVSNARVHDDHNAISADGASVLAKYDTDTSQPGGAFCKNICSKGNPPQYRNVRLYADKAAFRYQKFHHHRYGAYIQRHRRCQLHLRRQ